MYFFFLNNNTILWFQSQTRNSLSHLQQTTKDILYIPQAPDRASVNSPGNLLSQTFSMPAYDFINETDITWRLCGVYVDKNSSVNPFLFNFREVCSHTRHSQLRFPVNRWYVGKQSLCSFIISRTRSKRKRVVKIEERVIGTNETSAGRSRPHHNAEEKLWLLQHDVPSERSQQ